LALNALANLLNGVVGQAVAAVPSNRVEPEKVSIELIHQAFLLSDPVTRGIATISAGSEVQAVAWDNASAAVDCRFAGPPAVTLAIPKRHLRPKRTPVTGLHPYSANLDVQAETVERAELDLEEWLAREAEYQKTGTADLWRRERDRLQQLLAKRVATLNRKLIQELMFNRFDQKIADEVQAANTARGLSGADALDPNLLKALFFEESQLGTSGQHLEDPPSHPVRSRFNLGQVIDSSGLAFMTFFQLEQPTYVTRFNLGSFSADLNTAQLRYKELSAKATRTAAEEAELTQLKRKAARYWETFIYEYRAAGSAVGFGEALIDLLHSSAPPKHLDYGFWIQMAVFWLFYKRRSTKDWPSAIRAFNGVVAGKTGYRDRIVKRAADAAAAAAAGDRFIPDRI
jgi:hypothetical protein